jgi:hypothetical protein
VVEVAPGYGSARSRRLRIPGTGEEGGGGEIRIMGDWTGVGEDQDSPSLNLARVDNYNQIKKQKRPRKENTLEEVSQEE